MRWTKRHSLAIKEPFLKRPFDIFLSLIILDGKSSRLKAQGSQLAPWSKLHYSTGLGKKLSR